MAHEAAEAPSKVIDVKSLSTKVALLAAAATLAAGAAQAQEAIYNHLRVEGSLDDRIPNVVAGDPNGNPPDSATNRIDPNLASSPYSGVVSLNIRYWGLNTTTGQMATLSYICSGAMISPVHVLTAGHCIDTNGQGTPITLGSITGTVGQGDVRVIFNNQATATSANTYTLGTASSVTMHSDYNGFNICPPGVTGSCLNDDIAVVTLAAPAPEWAKIYRVDTGFADSNTAVTHVGFGTTGDGVAGHYAGSSSFFIKRTGQNYIDRPLDLLDDEQNFAGGAPEVWVADFDSAARGIDAHCDYFGVCSGILPNNVETNIGGGDSGGPTFKQGADGEWLLIGNNTFGRRFFQSQVSGVFGTAYGGMILGAYADWLVDVTGGQVQVVPEPETYALMLGGLAAIGAVARRRRLKA